MEIDVSEKEPETVHAPDLLGGRIRKLRKAQERTLDSLAQEVGLTKGYLSKVETGRQTPPLGRSVVRGGSSFGYDYQ